MRTARKCSGRDGSPRRLPRTTLSRGRRDDGLKGSDLEDENGLGKKLFVGRCRAPRGAGVSAVTRRVQRDAGRTAGARRVARPRLPRQYRY